MRAIRFIRGKSYIKVVKVIGRQNLLGPMDGTDFVLRRTIDIELEVLTDEEVLMTLCLVRQG